MDKIKDNDRSKFLRDEYISRINRVVDYIELNIDKDLSLEKLASVANFSRFHFHRIFKAIMGETLNRHIQRIRVEKAAVQLINNPKKTITEIAFDCGFSGSAPFARAFKDFFKMNASRWRRTGNLYEGNIGKIDSNKGKAISKIRQDFGVFSSIIASKIVAKEIEENTIDILLSCPITRAGLILIRLIAAAIILALATLLTFAFTIIGLVILGMPVRLDILAAAFLSGFLLCLAFGSVSLLVSVFIPQQNYTLFITIGIMFAMFAYEELLIKVISFLEYLPFLSLFHFYRPGEILIHGSISAANPLILLGYFALFSLIAVALFKGKDIPV
ncbi:MAG: helix-turn-helix domain-containing protein [Deltaproteobacteria bacterium]|uniref:Helix-turn-helix domain-containing protein n=1 Tax=Candidatus Zymogenus saltonus TaxID=2844893 RepID=A0A9D8KCT9_9DELT|nr:helix-turn-helix domain-containing protein [Candidatus Zymogenus saltonus]